MTLALNAAQRAIKDSALQQIDSLGEALVELSTVLSKIGSKDLNDTMVAVVHALADVRNAVDSI